MKDAEIAALQNRLEYFDNNGYHIVAMIGTRQSGKSSIICDMFSHFFEGAKKCGEVIVLGQMSEADNKAWDKIITPFQLKKEVQRTDDEPFFVAMNASTATASIKVAFLEVRGEVFTDLPDPAVRTSGGLNDEHADKYFRSVQSRRAITWLIVGNYESRAIENKQFNEDAYIQKTLHALRSKRSTS